MVGLSKSDCISKSDFINHSKSSKSDCIYTFYIGDIGHIDIGAAVAAWKTFHFVTSQEEISMCIRFAFDRFAM